MPTPTFCCRSGSSVPASAAPTPGSPPSSPTGRCAGRATTTASSNSPRGRGVDADRRTRSSTCCGSRCHQLLVACGWRSTPRSTSRSSSPARSAPDRPPVSSTACCAPSPAPTPTTGATSARDTEERRRPLGSGALAPGLGGPGVPAGSARGGQRERTRGAASRPTTWRPRVSAGRTAGARGRRRARRRGRRAGSRRSRRSATAATRGAGLPCATGESGCRTRARSWPPSPSACPADRCRASAGSTCAPARAARRRCSPPKRWQAARSSSRTSSYPRAPNWCATRSRCSSGPLRCGCGDGTQRRRERCPERFDRILLDAPCTGLGALRRRPEARWRKQPRDVPELATLQGELLDVGASPRSRRAGCSPTSPARRTWRDPRRSWSGALKRPGRASSSTRRGVLRRCHERARSSSHRRRSRAAVAAPARHRRDVHRTAAEAPPNRLAEHDLRINPSILSADFVNLERDIARDRDRRPRARGRHGQPLRAEPHLRPADGGAHPGRVPDPARRAPDDRRPRPVGTRRTQSSARSRSPSTPRRPTDAVALAAQTARRSAPAPGIARQAWYAHRRLPRPAAASSTRCW